jgi:hypothetical protein
MLVGILYTEDRGWFCSLVSASTTIECYVDLNNFSLEVRDNGCGIHEECLRRLGERYSWTTFAFSFECVISNSVSDIKVFSSI